MPWKECNHMDERLRFVAKLLDGEKMAAVCREFKISHKTGYKIFKRYKGIGLLGLQNQGRTPYRYANKLPFQVEKAILSIKQDHSSWGALDCGRIIFVKGGYGSKILQIVRGHRKSQERYSGDYPCFKSVVVCGN
jgi:hypothetical protein